MGGGAPVRIGSKTELDRLVRLVNIVMKNIERKTSQDRTQRDLHGSRRERIIRVRARARSITIIQRVQSIIHLRQHA